MSAAADRVRATLDALVDEAYRKEMDRGVAITNPDGWRAWKRSVYVETAKREGAGYLRRHHQRLGLGTTYAERPKCPTCGGTVAGDPCRRPGDDAEYCSYSCAGVETMTLAEWLAKHPDSAGFLRRLRTNDPKEGTA